MWCSCLRSRNSGESGSLRHGVDCRLLSRVCFRMSCVRWIHNVGTAGGVFIGAWVGHPAAHAIAVQVCRIHMEPLMQPYAYVKNEVHDFEFHGLCICLLSRALVAV